MQQLTYTRTENPSTNIHGNQQSIDDINTQRQELDIGILISNTLNGKMNSQQLTNASWPVTMIKATLKTPIHKFENPIFSFRRTHDAAVRNRKILAAFNVDLGAEIAAQKDSPVNYGSEFRNTADLTKLFFYHEYRAKIVNIIQQGSCYHLDPIEEETQKSDLDTMILRGVYKSYDSELNSYVLDRAIIKVIDHRWALPITI